MNEPLGVDPPTSCPQCGRRLDATLSIDGSLVCPTCAHSTTSLASEGRSTRVFGTDDASASGDGDRFVLSGILGQGGFGIVYKAFDRTLRRYVAIKAPRNASGDFDPEQFILEARAASALRHPNIVTVFDVGSKDGEPFIVSDCIDGVTLRNWLEGSQANFEACARLVEKLCRAVAYAHAADVVHRDIKPSNVIVDDDDEPHLLDFGLSRSRTSGEVVEFRKSVPVGTPAYMAPEQACGDSDRIGKPADIYALGVVLYQALTRRLPFVGSPSRILDSILHEDPVRPRTLNQAIPPGLEAIALKAMQKDVERRYADAGSMADDLVRYLEGRPVRALGRHDVRSLTMTARRGFIGGVAAVATFGFLGSLIWAGVEAYRDDRRVRVRLQDGSSDVQVTWIPADSIAGKLDSRRSTPSAGDAEVALEPGLYRIEARRGAEVRHVWRTVPTSAMSPVPHLQTVDKRDIRPLWKSWTGDDSVVVPNVEFGSRERVGMEFVDGCSIDFDSALYPTLRDTYQVAPFYLDRTTATVRDVIDVYDDAMNNPTASLDAEAALTFEFAIDFAERRQLRLMTVWEWYAAATNGGTTNFPWGDAAPSNLTHASLRAIDVCRDRPNVTGLCSGLREWTETMFGHAPKRSAEVRESKEDLPRRWLNVGLVPPVSDVPLPSLMPADLKQFHFSAEETGKVLAVRCVSAPF